MRKIKTSSGKMTMYESSEYAHLQRLDGKVQLVV